MNTIHSIRKSKRYPLLPLNYLWKSTKFKAEEEKPIGDRCKMTSRSSSSITCNR